MVKTVGNKNQQAVLLLRVGLAIVFLYAGFFSLRDPNEWIGYLPNYLVHGLSASSLLKVTAIYELLLALWLLSGKYLRYAAALAALTLAFIILSNWSQLYITFRDFGLLFAAVALFVLEWP